MTDVSRQNDEAVPRPLQPWASLRYRDFSVFFCAALFINTAQHMRQTQNLYQVYELSGSAFQLGLTGLAQAIPLFAVGLFGGTLADLFDRRKLILLTLTGNFFIAAALGVLTLTGSIQVWHILASTSLTAVVHIVLQPARMALMYRLVPRTHLMNAVSLHSSVGQAAHFIGPMVAGLSIAWISAGNAYLLNALCYVPAATGIFLLRAAGGPAGARRETVSLKSVMGGVQFLRSQRVLFALSFMDLAVMGVGCYQPLLPVFAKDIFKVGPASFGLLASAPSVGGMLAIFVLLMAGDVKRKGLLALWAFLAYSLCVGVFAVVENFWLALLLVGLLGATNSVQAVMRQTAFQLLTPDHLRGRTFAVFTMFSHSAGALGAMEVGFAATLLGAPGALLLGSVVGIVLTLTFWATHSDLRRFRSETTVA
jgi:MFS family permease